MELSNLIYKEDLYNGATGPTGPAINLSIGTVETGAPGSTATATITGTSPNYVLNLTIPAGPTGPAGT